MKKLLLALICILTLSLMAAPSFAAFCGGQHRGCWTKAGKGKHVGTKYVDLCWSWKSFSCVYCKNGAHTGNDYPAKVCNEAYPECEGDCWSCDGKPHEGGCCLDREGHQHGSCD